MTVETSVPRSRRALLAGALGGLGAWVAAAAAKVSPTQAAAGSSLIIGSEANNAGTANTQLIANSDVVTFKLYQTGPGTALMGYTTTPTGATRGVYGRVDSPSGFGLQGRNAGAAGSGAAIQAIGVNNHGLDASTDNGARYAVRGVTSSTAPDAAAVYGEVSSTSPGTASAAVRGANKGTSFYGIGVWGSHAGAGYGVYGKAVSGDGVRGTATTGTGVRGTATTGNGVYGIATSGYAGHFVGRMAVSQYIDVTEMTAPANPASNRARLFVRDNGGKTQLCVIFPTGLVQVIKAEL